MFSSAAHSAVHFARRTVFTSVSKQARFLSVTTVCSTKNLYRESILLSEKPNKAAKAKKDNGKKFEQSQLYPNEVEKLGNYDLMEEFDKLMDDNIQTPLIQRDIKSDKVDSVAGKPEAVDKMPSIQRDLKSDNVDSVARKSEAIDKMPSVHELKAQGKPESVAAKFDAVDWGPSTQEVGRSVWPKSVGRKSEAVEELEISETEEIDLDERLSDSDSESDTEDNFYGTRKRVYNFQVNLKDLNITSLTRRSRFLRTEMEKACSRQDGMVFTDEIGGIFALAKMGITPEALFVCFPGALKYYPADLSNTALYMIPLEDMKYWATRVKNPRIAMIGLYRQERLRIKSDFPEPEMPLTIICDRLWHRIGFSQIINSVNVTPPKLFVTSKDCINPWHGSIVRNSYGAVASVNHHYGLTWEEIQQKVGENDRLYVLEVPPTRDHVGGEIETQWLPHPPVYLYDHNFWDTENIALIVMGSLGKRIPEEISRFCLERKASKIDVGVAKRTPGPALFHMVFFEMRRQWLAAVNGSGSENVKTAKSRGGSSRDCSEITIR